ncbi:hypothetical protein M8C21_025942 [Ambrosia artemisiifolia]|uniref:Uncharacterized protein n=1 Tax=Ambrosia artemisiifolia TaxID=4212 RepID=A0AAD5GBX6_AMBAR|nr:hypothetical protein M8C21_025942 [Ambrosia artemisiifolia]
MLIPPSIKPFFSLHIYQISPSPNPHRLTTHLHRPTVPSSASTLFTEVEMKVTERSRKAWGRQNEDVDYVMMSDCCSGGSTDRQKIRRLQVTLMVARASQLLESIDLKIFKLHGSYKWAFLDSPGTNNPAALHVTIVEVPNELDWEIR